MRGVDWVLTIIIGGVVAMWTLAGIFVLIVRMCYDPRGWWGMQRCQCVECVECVNNNKEVPK